MNLYIRAQYCQYLTKYLEQLLGVEIKNDKTKFVCPVCKEVEKAQLYPNNGTKFYCLNPDCTFKKGDIFDLVRATKNPKFKDEDIASYLKHKFKIIVKDDIDEILKLYDKNKFTLFPLEPQTKDPKYGFMWTEKLYIDPVIWKDWIDRGYGLGLRLGKVSNTIAIDVDDDKTYEKVKHLLGEDTLIQITKRGKHWVFCYDEDFNFLMHANLRKKNDPENNLDMEVRANNAYIAIAPTSAEGEIRKWNNKKIQKMSPELKQFLLDKIDKNAKTPDEEIQEAITNNDLGGGIKGLDGCCNDSFIKMGGILRKRASVDITRYALTIFNNALDNPMDNKAINGIIRQLDKYQTYDKKELSQEVFKRLEIIKEGTAFQIASSLKKETKDVEDVLRYLDDNNKVISLSGRKYQVLEDVEWTHEKGEMGVPIDFRCPFFHDYARFNKGGMIIIGSPTGKGKTHITGNIIKQLWAQKRVTHLINTEADSNIGAVTHYLKIPDEAYLIPKKPVNHPTDIELKDNAITVIDWLKMKDGDFAKTDNNFEHFSKQLKKHSGFMIVLTQIRTENSKWFAPDQTKNYVSLSAKYLWGNNGQDGENTYFLTDKIRDSKSGKQYITIPTFFNQDTKILEIRK